MDSHETPPYKDHDQRVEKEVRDFGIDAALDELFDTDNLTREKSNQLLCQLDCWLMNNESGSQFEDLTQKEAYIEKKWVATERRKMVEQQRGGEGNERVLAPNKERMLLKLFDRLKQRTGAGALVYGVPGTGKSFFMEMLVRKLEKNGIVHGHIRVNGSPGTFSETMSRGLLEDREFNWENYSKILEGIPNLPEERRGARLKELLAKIALDVRGKFLFPEFRDETFVASQIESLGIHSEDTLEVIIQKLNTFLNEQIQAETADGLRRVEPGPLMTAALAGLVCLYEEMDKFALNGLFKFGHGSELFLDAKPGDTIHDVRGIPIRVTDKYLVLGTTNDLSQIPDNIYRRFIDVKFESNAAELVWQARVLLADESGESLLHNRPEVEHQLAAFLLCWEALGRHKRVAFNINALDTLCKEIKQGADFSQAINVVLSENSEFLPVYQSYMNQTQMQFDSQEMSDSPAYLTLSELNWLANKQYMGRETDSVAVVAPQRDLINFNDNTALEKNTSPIFVRSNYTDAGSVLSLTQRGSSSEDDVAFDTALIEHSTKIRPVDVVSSSPLGQSVALYGDDPARFIDMSTGYSMAIVAEKTNYQSGKIEKTAAKLEIFALQWYSETKGICVAKTQQGNQLIAFEKELVLPTKESEFWTPQISIKQSISLPADVSHIQLSNTFISFRTENQQYSYVYQPDNLAQTLRPRKPRENERIVTGELGSFVFSPDGSMQWVR